MIRPAETQRGVTLVELVIAITVVAISVATILGVIGAISSRSADAMVQQQAVAVAQAYLDEILQRWVVDPNGTPPNTGRGSWDLVDQYNGLARCGRARSIRQCHPGARRLYGERGDLAVERPPGRAVRRRAAHRHHRDLSAERQRHAVGLPDQLLMRAPTARGFTLIEMVITIAVGAVVVAFMAMFIVLPMDAYTAQTRRAGLVDAQRQRAALHGARHPQRAAQQRPRRRRAARVTALELLATADGARYQDDGPRVESGARARFHGRGRRIRDHRSVHAADVAVLLERATTCPSTMWAFRAPTPIR